MADAMGRRGLPRHASNGPVHHFQVGMSEKKARHGPAYGLNGSKVARAATATVASSFSAEIDHDYLGKPFTPKEAAAGVEKYAKRHFHHNPSDCRHRYGLCILKHMIPHYI